MAGVAGRSGGHNQKRPEAKLGNLNHAKTAMPGFTRIEAFGEPSAVIPSPGNWGMAAMQFWSSALELPTRTFAESTDYAYLWIVCAAIDECSKNGYRAGQLQTIQAMMSDIGATEIQRRQAKLLIDREPPAPVLEMVSQEDEAAEMFGA